MLSTPFNPATTQEPHDMPRTLNMTFLVVLSFRGDTLAAAAEAPSAAWRSGSLRWLSPFCSIPLYPATEGAAEEAAAGSRVRPHARAAVEGLGDGRGGSRRRGGAGGGGVKQAARGKRTGGGGDEGEVAGHSGRL